MYDILIKDITIVDGTGSPSFIGSIGILEGRINFVSHPEYKAKKIINGNDLCLAPGFIDIHSHPDDVIEHVPLCENFIAQGITTLVGGNCGLQTIDYNESNFAKFLDNKALKGIAANFVPLVGFGSIRTMVLKNDFKRPANKEEIERMKNLVEEGMQAGAYGFSTGLDYDPQEFASTHEIIELAKIAGKYNGIYATHHYHFQDQWATDDPDELGYGVFHGPIEDAWYGLHKGLLQAIKIGEEAEVPVQISHMGNVFKVLQPHLEAVDEACASATLDIIDQARKRGVDVSFDTFPNNTSICGPRLIISEFLSPRMQKMQWLKRFSKGEFLDSLLKREFRDKIIALDRAGRLKFNMIHTKVNPFWPHYFTIVKSVNTSYEMKTIAQLIGASSIDPLDFLFDLILEDPEITWTQNVDTRLIGPTAQIFIQHPFGMPITDATCIPEAGFAYEDYLALNLQVNPDERLSEEQLQIIVGSPNFYGLFAEYIHTFVVLKKILSIEEAIYKITGLPAWRLGLDDRGTIKQDSAADLVIFDLDTINTRSTLKKVMKKPAGIKYVIVNGTIVYEQEKFTGEKPGKVLSKGIVHER